MQVPIKDIIVKKRMRKDMGDITVLAESMKRFGQINPITLSKKNILITGGRRLEAARSLGWRTINAAIIDAPERLAKLEYEIEENIQRQDLLPEEIARATRELYKLKNPGIFRRLWNALVRAFKYIFRITE
ncbi:MAG: ParB N-terminal domain-containing protein [Treponema sp.]|jgi:ParB family chromosome partitioning protein|nr:ParB N-terminal domain-containing protein [Treponema sp.]